MNAGACRQCGACSEVCPIVERDAARVVHEVYCREDFDPWLCCSCQLCAGACPVGLSARDAMFAVRRIAHAGEGAARKRVEAHMAGLRRRGFLFPVGEVSNDERREMNLPPVPHEKIAHDIKAFVRNYEEVMESFAVGWGGM